MFHASPESKAVQSEKKNMTHLLRRSAAAIVLVLAASPAFAQQDTSPTVHGIPIKIAIEGAQTALATCAGRGHITVIVVDEMGFPIVMLSDNGAHTNTQRLGPIKARIAAKLRMPSSEAASRYKTDDQLMFQLVLDAQLGIPLPGGLPIMIKGVSQGGIAVSGSAGNQDERCAQPGLDRIQQLLATK